MPAANFDEEVSQLKSDRMCDFLESSSGVGSLQINKAHCSIGSMFTAECMEYMNTISICRGIPKNFDAEQSLCIRRL